MSGVGGGCLGKGEGVWGLGGCLENGKGVWGMARVSGEW